MRDDTAVTDVDRYAETDAIRLADYLLARKRERPGADDVLDRIGVVTLRASSVRAVVDALITCQRDVKLARQPLRRTRVDHAGVSHTLVPADDVPPHAYRQATCTCGESARVVDHGAAEVWHALHERWPVESAAELATRMRSALRAPAVVGASSSDVPETVTPLEVPRHRWKKDLPDQEEENHGP